MRRWIKYGGGKWDDLGHLPKSLTSIGNEAFSGCDSLATLYLPTSLTSIGRVAFSWCNSLTTIHLPASLTTIGDGVFFECLSLTSIYIPKDSKERFGRLLDKQWLIDKLVEE